MQTNFIDTHKFVKSYVKAKTAEKQAEVISEAFNAIQDSNFQKLATKQDIKDAIDYVILGDEKEDILLEK